MRRRVCRNCALPLYKPEGNEEGSSPLGSFEPLLDCDCHRPEPERDPLDAPEFMQLRQDEYEKFTIPLVEYLTKRGKGMLHAIEVQESLEPTWEVVRKEIGV